MRAFFEIGIYHSKSSENIGTLWRSAYQLGASGIFTVGQRYKHQSSDTLKTYGHIPLRCYLSWEEFCAARPMETQLIAIEIGGKPLSSFVHPQQAIYLLGAEDHGLPKNILQACQHVIELESARTPSYNVAVAGSLVMYQRLMQVKQQEGQKL